MAGYRNKMQNDRMDEKSSAGQAVWEPFGLPNERVGAIFVK